MRLFHHYSDLLSLLQCQSATNVTMLLYSCMLIYIKINKNKKLGEEKQRQIIVKTALDAEIQLYVWGIRVRFGVIILGNISRYYFAHSITQEVLKYGNLYINWAKLFHFFSINVFMQ